MRAGAVAGLTVCIGAGAAAQSGKAPAAKVGDEVITFEELEQSVKPQLAKIEEQRFSVLDEKLETVVERRQRNEPRPGDDRNTDLAPRQILFQQHGSPITALDFTEA